MLACVMGTAPLLVGCGDRGVQWSLYNVRGHLPDLDFALVGPNGAPFTQADVQGKTVLMFFGFASCPDVCPTTMANLTEVLRLLGPDAQDVRILFVSVDPHRDTPDRLQAYVSAFNTSAIGLTGDRRAIAALAKRYRVAYQIEAPKNPDDPGQYDVTHSRGVYIFDREGRARLLASDTDAPATLAHDIGQLISLTRA
ncbi:MAG: SCO family protein [Comamonadaceae bacterium]|nr:MAG: SCO family protein [Comamonadaceae bacterium]